MKQFFVLLFFTIITFSTTAQSKTNQKAVIKTEFFCSHCKVCETCGKNLQANLYKIKGLKMYELDEEKMTITVYYNSKKTTLEIIKKAISDLGFDADEVKANPLAYEKLDDCCKKA